MPYWIAIQSELFCVWQNSILRLLILVDTKHNNKQAQIKRPQIWVELPEIVTLLDGWDAVFCELMFLSLELAENITQYQQIV